MIHKLSWLVLLCTAAGAFSQQSQRPALMSPAPHLFTMFGTFEQVAGGWQCKYAGTTPALLQEMQVNDVLLAIDGQDLAKANAIGLLQLLRTVEFGLARSVEANRGGRRLKWTTNDGAPRQIIASQTSFEVLRSSVPGVREGDVLNALSQATFAAMMSQVQNPLTSVATVEARAGKVLHLVRDGQAVQVNIESPAVLPLIHWEMDMGENSGRGSTLQGLNTANVSLASLRGRWTLLHFWATWCAPCIRHMPDIRELARQKNLNLAAIGFADTNERLAEAGAREKDMKVYAPDLGLQRELAITGIPFEVLLDPQGTPVFVVSGDMPGDKFKAIVMEYVGR